MTCIFQNRAQRYYFFFTRARALEKKNKNISANVFDWRQTNNGMVALAQSFGEGRKKTRSSFDNNPIILRISYVYVTYILRIWYVIDSGKAGVLVYLDKILRRMHTTMTSRFFYHYMKNITTKRMTNSKKIHFLLIFTQKNLRK